MKWINLGICLVHFTTWRHGSIYVNPEKVASISARPNSEKTFIRLMDGSVEVRHTIQTVRYELTQGCKTQK